MTRIFLDSTLFDDDAISEETRNLNADIVATLSAAPDQWSFPPEVIRQRRKEGKGPFPAAPLSERAREIFIQGSGGDIRLRIITPEKPSGIYLHFHGGGWVLGSPEEQDPRMERIADNCNLACVSVDYRLAPENPYPAGPDDCETAALWLVKHAMEHFGTERMMIGGESAGAHLSVVTLLRLRDNHQIQPFSGVNLVAGCYDLHLTPSARNWGTEKLILNSRDIAKFTDCFIPDNQDKSNPDISPIHANLSQMPPALFTVGTRDPLLDDTLFMSSRWLAAGHTTETAIYPGGAHVFMAFPGKMSEASLKKIEDFLISR
ncbi:MAG: alpha/beta hydrolase [Fimbriimonadaceae bacterium]|nr:alpha/beta hydrolase [Alphaproteobacteria bacterium]